MSMTAHKELYAIAQTLAQALNDNLTSPNEPDRNFENANVVDGLFEIARALRFVAKAILVTSNMDIAELRGRLEHWDQK